MYLVTGRVLKVFTAPPGTNKDGKSYGGDTRIQLLGDLILKNGESKNELITLSVPSGWSRAIQDTLNKVITLPVALMASGNVVKPFIPDNAILPELRSKSGQNDGSK